MSSPFTAFLFWKNPHNMGKYLGITFLVFFSIAFPIVIIEDGNQLYSHHYPCGHLSQPFFLGKNPQNMGKYASRAQIFVFFLNSFSNCHHRGWESALFSSLSMWPPFTTFLFGQISPKYGKIFIQVPDFFFFSSIAFQIFIIEDGNQLYFHHYPCSHLSQSFSLGKNPHNMGKYSSRAHIFCFFLNSFSNFHHRGWESTLFSSWSIWPPFTTFLFGQKSPQYGKIFIQGRDFFFFSQ